jgi:hypothetical protein
MSKYSATLPTAGDSIRVDDAATHTYSAGAAIPSTVHSGNTLAAVTTADQGDAATATIPALRTAAAGVPQDMGMGGGGNTRGYSGDSTITPLKQTLDVQGRMGGAGMPGVRDGVMAWDTLLSSLPVSVATDVMAAPLPFLSDGMVDTRASLGAPRVSNNATLYWTGQGFGADQDIPTTAAEGDTYRDATSEAAWRQAQTQSIYEHSARAHPSTYGKGAEFRNKYIIAGDRKGLVTVNPETQRNIFSPARAVMEKAAADQLARSAYANTHKDPVMYASAVAYESDYGVSDVE